MAELVVQIPELKYLADNTDPIAIAPPRVGEPIADVLTRTAVLFDGREDHGSGPICIAFGKSRCWLQVEDNRVAAVFEPDRLKN